MSDTRKTEERPLPEQLKAHAEACAEADCIVNRNQYCHFGPADSCPEVAAHYLTLTARLEAAERLNAAMTDDCHSCGLALSHGFTCPVPEQSAEAMEEADDARCPTGCPGPCVIGCDGDAYGNRSRFEVIGD